MVFSKCARFVHVQLFSCCVTWFVVYSLKALLILDDSAVAPERAAVVPVFKEYKQGFTPREGNMVVSLKEHNQPELEKFETHPEKRYRSCMAFPHDYYLIFYSIRKLCVVSSIPCADHCAQFIIAHVSGLL